MKKSFLKFLVLIFLIGAPKIFANMAAPSQGGNPLLEPRGIKTIDILHEDLTIDFNALDFEKRGSRRGIDVEAIYRVNILEDARNLELVFVILSEAENFRLFLDDKEIQTSLIDNKETISRSDWKEPLTTPHEGKEIMYNPNTFQLRSAKFTLNLPKGEHVLKANYKAAPTFNENAGLTTAWQFAYSLAPVRDWKSFGGLSLKVKYPENWKIFTNLPLNENSGYLSGEFKEIPADFLAITTQAPVPQSYKIADEISFWLIILSFVVPPVLMVLYFWLKRPDFKRNWAFGFVFGIIWAVIVFSVIVAAANIPSFFLPKYQAASYGYEGIGTAIAAVSLSVLAFALGLILWIAADFISSLRKNK